MILIPKLDYSASFHKTFLFVVIVLLSTGPLSCGNESKTEPQTQTIKLIITDGNINLSPEQLKVDQGDIVTLKVISDKHGMFHLHGYDHELSVGPDAETELTFGATATGRFNFTFHFDVDSMSHSMSSNDDHGALFESNMLENGHEFTFTVTEDLIGQEIIYHNHMNHTQIGSITVSSPAGVTDTFLIKIQTQGVFNPQHIDVPPGSSIVWTNTVHDRQRIVSGHPPSTSGTHEEHEEYKEDETPLGSLEVHPR